MSAKRHLSQNSSQDSQESETDDGIATKRFKTDTSSDESSDDNDGDQQASSSVKYSNPAMRMMQNMGYKQNTGLGRMGQGRLEPVEASSQKGRRGLGLKLEDLDLAAMKWDKSMESPLSIPEVVEWYECETAEQELAELDGDLLWSWVQKGRRKLNIDDETYFCDPEVLESILKSKTVFDKLGAADMVKARTRANPFETIKHNVFQNRAAVKMANMDAMFDFMFTNPVDMEGNPLVREDDLLYFADVCAGPGGFSEYVLYRKGWEAKGFGFTLRAENDFKLHDFNAGHPETFDPYYGINGDGNVFDPENCASLKDYVLKQVGEGVHFMMSDGGFSVEGQENLQEILSKQLYLCQCLVALQLVRVNGHFVTKLFDIFTPFSVGLIYLMSRCFHSISICKPNTSRPANSERYLVCKWKRPGTKPIEDHLFRVNDYLWGKRQYDDNDKQKDVLGLVPLEKLIEEDKKFFQYIYESNNNFGRVQIEALLKIAAFTKDNNLIDERQSEVKKQCLELWKLEDKMRRGPPKVPNFDYVKELLGTWISDQAFIDAPAKPLDPHLGRVFHQIHDWYFVPLERKENSYRHLRTFFMSRGGHNVLAYNPDKRSWVPNDIPYIEMSPKTLIYGELVKEYRGHGKNQSPITALHIIDGIVLGGQDIRRDELSERNRKCKKFARALNKPLCNITGPDGNQRCSVPIRCKKLYPLKDFSSFANSLDDFPMKSGGYRRGIWLQKEGCDAEERYYTPEGLLFLKGTNDDFYKCFSKSRQEFYYADKRSRVSTFVNPEITREASASFKGTFVTRHVWQWDEKQSNLDEQQSDDGSRINRQHLDDYIANALN